MANHNILKLNNQILQFDNPNKEYERRRFKVLWENTSKTSMFEGTEINLSNDDYDMLFWIFSTSVSGIQNNCLSACMKGNNCILYTSTISSNIQVRRQLNYVSDTKYTVSAGYAPGGEDYNNAIPLYCIGIKF